MRLILLCVITFLITGFANAQGPTITSAGVAVPGDKFTYPGAKLTGVAIPATGANITWDYSALVDSGDVEIDSFISPSSTPYHSLFPASNLALNSAGDQFVFYLTNTSDWATVGFITPGTDTTYYAKPFSNIHFPFSYGSTFTDSTDLTFYQAGFSQSIREITFQQATGYGTLKLPGKTYTNVLQINQQTTQRYIFGSFTSTSIIFATPGEHSFIMNVALGTQNKLIGIRYKGTGSVITPSSYTFNGNGNWNNPANWSGNVVPTSPVPSGTEVTISPQPGGACILNVPVTFTSGATLTVTTGAEFEVMGNLTINK